MLMDKELLFKFHNSYLPNAYEYFGPKFITENNQEYIVFRVYAPHATKVSVVGDFNHWNIDAHQMTKVSRGGVWEIKIKNDNLLFLKYKFYIENNTKKLYKQDPYSNLNETEGGSCSIVYKLPNFKFTDQEWITKRSTTPPFNQPMNIYEVHLGSWKKKDGGFFNYREIADQLIPYVVKMGYTHIEIMPITEYPYGGSWGYQVTGYFSVTSRYGMPDDFMYLVNKAHEHNIGVILDWVPAHFPKDEYSLIEFDGEYVYENPEPTKMEHRNWGTRIFNFSKPEVKSFLISSAIFFFDKFHIDGLRVDAVASMLYLDYDREIWIPNKYGGNYHLEAIEFLQDLNKEVFYRFPNVLMIAEESTAFPKITYPVDVGGLGFNFKWNMGWMNDSLSYVTTDFCYRSEVHHKLTFPMSYAFSENFVLPISHDEVVHGKKSLLDKMPGVYEEKFAGVRAFLGYMMTHPGKKLNFMGYELGHFIEWNEVRELDWFLLDYPMHKKLFDYVRDLNHLYLQNSCLWENDYSWDGFRWLNPDDKENNVLSYQRFNCHGESLVIVINFSNRCYEHYYLNLNDVCEEVFNSDDEKYGGSGIKNNILIPHNYQLVLKIPSLSCIILKVKRE